MVRMIPDKTGRFARRPFYDQRELDDECERLIGDFLQERHAKVEYPVATDDLTVLIEMHAEELDSCADLTCYGDDMEGVTEFFSSAPAGGVESRARLFWRPPRFFVV